MGNQKTKLLFRLRSMETGGVQKVLLTILELLDKKRFDITLLVNLQQGELQSQIPKDVKTFFLAKGKESFSKNKMISHVQKAIRLCKLKLYHAFPQLIKFKLKDIYDFDIAFSYDMFSIVEKTNSLADKKIGWMHGDLRNFAYTQKQKIKVIESIKKLDTVVYVSNQTKNVIDEMNGSPLTNSIVIHNPINVNEIIRKSKEYVSEELSSSSKDGIPSFLFVGRISRGKGVHLLYEAHKKLCEENEIHKVYIIGRGHYEDAIKMMDKENSFIGKTFIFLGMKENPYPYFSAADFFVLPSQSEAYPLSIPEALILGKPVLTTEVGGVREMMEDHINGLIVSISSESIYQGMKELLENPALVSKIKENNKKCAEKFNPQRNIDLIEKLLTK